MAAEQARFQIRFDWGVDGLAAVGSDADVVVWVDALTDAGAETAQPPAVPETVGHVIAAALPSARAAARWVLELQQRLGARLQIAVIAAGAERPGGGYRFAVEDQLAAGAVIAELGQLGLDATSPEAAAAEAAFRGLERAAAHVLSASVSAVLSSNDGAAAPAPAWASLGRVDPDLGPADVVVLSSRG